jgi:hypothetical protein
LISACGACNYGGGARVAADNGRRRVERLEQIILDQDQKIVELQGRLAAYEAERSQAALRKDPPKPAIYYRDSPFSPRRARNRLAGEKFF